MKNHYELIKSLALTRCENVFKLGNLYMNEESYPTYLNAMSWGISDYGEYAGLFHHCVTVYYSDDLPQYYRDPEMLELAYRALCIFESHLREDGSMDLITTNFHDPAQTAFCIQSNFYITELLVRFTEHTEVEDRLFEKIKSILLKMGHGLVHLGFHTPNHRWVVSSAFAVCYRYTGEQEFLDTLEGFLMEGIDCDEYGEYTERSTGSYNNICNYSFMILGYMLDRPEFYEYPRRNLRLMMHFTEPDGTVNTLNSTRWDNGGEYTIAPYYDYYLLLALMDKDPEFAYMADMIADKFGATPRGTFSFNVMTLFKHLRTAHEDIVSKAPDKDQTIFLPNSKIARVYRPNLDLTMTALASRSPVFFQMNWGSSILQLRFAGAFFGDPHAQFRAREIIPTEDGYRLICDENAGYRSQLSEKPETSDWRKMDHSKRQIVNVQNFHTEITVHMLEDGVTLDIETSGCDRIPTKLEISMQPNGKFFTDSVTMRPKEGEYIYLNGNAHYFIDLYRYFEIEGGFRKHTMGNDMRGTAPVNPKKFTIALTETTPQKSTVTIRAKSILN